MIVHKSTIDSVTPRFPVQPDWRIRTGFLDARPYTETLYLIFFFKAKLVPVGMAQTSNNSKYYIQIKRTTTGVVSIKIYTHITESHLLIQNCTFTFTNQSTEPTCSEPLQVCWPTCMRCLLTSSLVPTRIKNPC